MRIAVYSLYVVVDRTDCTPHKTTYYAVVLCEPQFAAPLVLLGHLMISKSCCSCCLANAASAYTAFIDIRIIFLSDFLFSTLVATSVTGLLFFAVTDLRLGT